MAEAALACGLAFFAQAVDDRAELFDKSLDFFAAGNIHGLAPRPRRRGHEKRAIRAQTAFFNADQRRLPGFLTKRDEITTIIFGKGKVAEQSRINITAVKLENGVEFPVRIADFGRRGGLSVHFFIIPQSRPWREACNPFKIQPAQGVFKMSDIFREVDEALQQEKAAVFWKEYGPTLMAAAVIVVLSTAATTAFMTWNHHRNAGETARLVAAMEDQNAAATMLQDIAKDSRGKHEALALITAAGMLGEKNDYAQAATLYKQAYENGAPGHFDGLARVLYVRSTLASGADSQADDLLATLKPVLNDKNNPWQWPAKIDAALIAAHLQKDYKAAAAHLQGADAAQLPPSLAQRAAALEQLYSAKAADQTQKDS